MGRAAAAKVSVVPVVTAADLLRVVLLWGFCSCALAQSPLLPPTKVHQRPAELQNLPYSARVLQSLQRAQAWKKAGQEARAIAELHQLLATRTPARSQQDLVFHQEIARAFLELGFSDHAYRTLQAASVDAEASGFHSEAEAIRQEIRVLEGAPQIPSDGWRPAGNRVSASGIRPVQALQTAPQPLAPTGPALPAPHQQAPTPPAAYSPRNLPPHPHRIGLRQRWRLLVEQLRPRPRAPRPAIPPLTTPGLPQYPRPSCQVCGQSWAVPSTATPPAPPSPYPAATLPNSAVSPGMPLQGTYGPAPVAPPTNPSAPDPQPSRFSLPPLWSPAQPSMEPLPRLRAVFGAPLRWLRPASNAPTPSPTEAPVLP
jgi:hypothetical protein